MFKYKKIVLYTCTILLVLLSLIELIKYFIIDNTLYGVFYLLINLIILFFLIPCAYNYKKYYSAARISKLIIIVVLGIFNCYILEHIIINTMSYVDSSTNYIKSIFIYKNIFKGIVYFILLLFTVFEFKLEKVLSKSISSKRLD